MPTDCCQYHRTGGPRKWPCGGWDYIPVRKLLPDPLLVALEAAYRARQAVVDGAATYAEYRAYKNADVALWLACDAAWGPTQQVGPQLVATAKEEAWPACSVCGERSHLAIAHSPVPEEDDGDPA